MTNKEGVDIVIEHVGSATWDESMKCLKPAGTLVTIKLSPFWSMVEGLRLAVRENIATDES